MHALYAVLILLTLLLFISVPLVCPFHLYLNYSGGDAAVYLRLLFLKIDLYRKDKDKKDGEKQKRKNKKDTFGPTVRLIIRIIGKLFSPDYIGDIKIRPDRIHIKIASKDAARTALLFSAAYTLLLSAAEYAEDKDILDKRAEKDIVIYPDFTSCKSEADISLVFTMTPIEFIDATLRAF